MDAITIPGPIARTTSLCHHSETDSLFQKARLACLFLLAGCSLCGCRSIYYSTWEKLGKQKRDLLQTKVKQVRDGQHEASQQLKDALARLQEVYGFQGGDLEKTYSGLKRDYDRSAAKAQGVKERIQQMNQIARDLFKEWEAEAKSITSASLRASSLEQLRDTRGRYEELYTATRKAEQSIEPVLGKFRDYVLYMKHNLNAQAIGALQGEAKKIQVDISQLIEEMNAAIRKADEFIRAPQ
jgi:predicted  nucleic acid-binding Zn-ribbon protein